MPQNQQEISEKTIPNEKTQHIYIYYPGAAGETIFTLPQGDYRFRADSEGVYNIGVEKNPTIAPCPVA